TGTGRCWTGSAPSRRPSRPTSSKPGNAARRQEEIPMHRCLRWLILPALMIGWLGLSGPPPARAAEDKLTDSIHDRAKVFSKDAVEKANKRLDKLQRDKGVDAVIDTYAELPKDARARYDRIWEKEKEKFKDEKAGQRKARQTANEKFF